MVSQSFNERELSHMEDVKAVVTGMRVALVVLYWQSY
jgi:hypothetical protein